MRTAAVDPITLAGVACFYCGCTEDDACLLDSHGEPVTSTGVSAGGYVGEPCSWYRAPDQNGFAVCSSAECVKSYIADQGAP